MTPSGRVKSVWNIDIVWKQVTVVHWVFLQHTKAHSNRLRIALFCPLTMETSLQEAFEENVRPFIDIIDELRSLGLDKDVPLPAVVVVGDQSAGKSSVLEAISGVELPRGTNIVTRCPLELRLKKVRKSKADELLGVEATKDMPSSWKGCISYRPAESSEDVTEVLEDPSEVGSAVEKAQGSLTGGAKEISDKLIHLEVQSQTVPDLTLIDLPGIARVAVEGQSAGVPDQIKALIKKYIEKEETIILAVIPCNVDIATTEALQLAQQVDSDGKRTLGVLTKPDLVDHGTEGDIVTTVNGEKVKLKLGYTVVKCRGQKAIQDKLSLKEAVESEDNFFKNNEILKVLYQEKKTGVQNLSHQLTKQLVEQIKIKMPGLKQEINTKLSEVEQELKIYGKGLPEEDHERQSFLIDLLMTLGEVFKKLAKAEHAEEEAVNKFRLFAKAKIVFQDLANNILQLKPSRTNTKLKEDVSEEIKARKGKELPSFLSYTVFEALVRNQIRKIIPHARECLKEVNRIVESITSEAIQDHLARFEPLKMEVNSLMNKERKKAEEGTREALKTLFAMENLVFTQDGNFTKLMKIIQQEDLEKDGEKNEKSLSGFIRNLSNWFLESEKMDADHMVKCLEAYCEVAATRLVDHVPMTIYYHLVKQLLERMATELMKLAAKPDSYKELLQEDPEIVFKRKKLQEKEERLEKANLKLMKFGSFSPNGVDSENGIEDTEWQF